MVIANLKGLLDKITSKVYMIVIVALITLSSTLYIAYDKQYQELLAANAALSKSELVINGNKTVIDDMRIELDKKPTEYITITKEVTKELCDSKFKQYQVMNLPSTNKGVENESNYADIDDRLPPDLIKLLQ